MDRENKLTAEMIRPWIHRAVHALGCGHIMPRTNVPVAVRV